MEDSQTANDRPAEAGASTSSPIRRYALTAILLAVCTCVGALLSLGATKVVQRDVTERALIGLTTDSEWPLHEAHISTAAGALDAALIEQVQLELDQPVDPSAVRLDRQRQDISGVLTVIAEAHDSTAAAALANEVARRMVAEVQPETPVQLLDPADGTAQATSTRATLVGGAVVGFVLALALLSVIDVAPSGRVNGPRS